MFGGVIMDTRELEILLSEVEYDIAYMMRSIVEAEEVFDRVCDAVFNGDIFDRLQRLDNVKYKLPYAYSERITHSHNMLRWVIDTLDSYECTSFEVED